MKKIAVFAIVISAIFLAVSFVKMVANTIFIIIVPSFGCWKR